MVSKSIPAFRTPCGADLALRHTMFIERARTREFWANIQKTPDCWLWIGRRNSYGYGVFRYALNAESSAHRFMWTWLNGPIPKGMVICHACDNTSCVRPHHLSLGTQLENVRDMHSKGRHPTITIRFTPDDIREIRRLTARGMSRRKIATQFNVHHGNIQAIIERRCWKHIV